MDMKTFFGLLCSKLHCRLWSLSLFALFKFFSIVLLTEISHMLSFWNFFRKQTVMKSRGYKLPNGNSSLKYFFWFRFGVSLVFKGIEMYHERSLLCKILNTFLQFLFSSRITSINIDASVNHFMRRCMFARSILWFWHHQDFNMNRFVCRREENYLYWQ